MSQLVQFIDGQWLAGEGKPFESTDPAKNEVIWQGAAASAAQGFDHQQPLHALPY